MGKIKKITALSIAAVIIAASLTGCGDYNTEDMSDTSEAAADITESQSPEIPDESIPVPETYEDYMKLAAAGYENGDWEIAHDCYQAAKELDGSRAEVYRELSDTYLHMGDVIKALAVLDEGIDKCVDKHDIDLLGQRKEYILAGMVAVGTNTTTNRYDDNGSILYERVWEGDTNGNKKKIKLVYWDTEGEISGLSEYQYDVNGNKIESKYIYNDIDRGINEYSHETWKYDADGREVENISYDENGNIEERTTHEYDENGNLLKEVVFDENNMTKRREKIKYDATGNVIETEHYATGHTVKTIYTYDENGKLIIRLKYDGQRISEKIRYEYDENGNKIKERHHEYRYGGERDFEYWLEYEYDENGREIKYARYDGDGTAVFLHEYEYDENGRMIKNVDYDRDSDGNINKIREYEYDEEGREIKSVHYEGDGIVVYWCEHEYDEDENEVRIKSYNSTGNLEYSVSEYKYDEKGRLIYRSHEYNDVVTEKLEKEYGEYGNIISEILTNYNKDTGKKIYEKVCRYTYDENGNLIKYDFTGREGKEVESFRWNREYDEDGRGIAFLLYDNEKSASYQSKTEYDENGRTINYVGYGKKGNVLVRKETEYDASGKVIKENYYDADDNLNQYYENEYDDFGSLTRQTMYENGVLKSEKQTSYAYHYIGNIDAEAADYMDHDMSLEEYNRKQREIFLRFLNGDGKVRYYRDEDNDQNGKIVAETITDLIDFEYIRKYKITPEYTFLDMTGDGIEELIIFHNGDTERLCVIQCSYGVLKVIHDIDGRVFDAYLVKCNGRTGIYRDCGIQNGEDRNFYYFLDDKGKKEILIEDDERYDVSDEDIKHFYSMYDSVSFENRDISKGVYYDIMSGMVTKTDIDWYKLEEPDYGND